MKKIILACGAGVATSTVVAGKISELLDKNGYEGLYSIVQCEIAEAKSQCAGADLLIATTVAPEGIECPYVNGVPFLTGMGRASAERDILAALAG
ncbi:phosphotransferase system lactose/cellobiose-specific IIB subunit [Coriobacterium glomerans PW2]|uniref:Phosphotransferase system lactose/cellobiose-specific IIB subunit n=1 Tax=Coriobacterium glomerans (strain ATCC 49209 / DSM 20642 / JCM 10262 / PW2) TaxID=700015 RepID=F2N898_CORGP|nr:PTS sugar transporter subunit IIB [Coriobacterium glomerans]AEB07281.1 phosphotransferase system lactose/cellobiose-specific IIB subunit [Coriobacterium glomerans PW2]